MTIDEAIKWELETAEHSTLEMGKYHKQVAEYLKELKSIKHDERFMQGVRNYHDVLSKEMHDLWRFYKKDTANRPKPSFMSAYSMVDLIFEKLRNEYDADRRED